MSSIDASPSHLGILALAVLLAGGGLFVDLVRADDPVAPGVVVAADSRAPAALPPQAPRVASAVIEVLRNGIGCADGEKPLAVKSAQLRWSGRLCWSQSRLEELEVVNERNRFSATLFAATDARFETDLIPLEVGMNRLRVRSKAAKDALKEQIIVVTRLEN